MKQLIRFWLVITVICITKNASAQNIAINDTGNAPDSTAILDISSTSKGLLIPRLTTAQRNSITSPAQGLLVYNTTDSSFYFYNNGWKRLSQSNENWALTGNAGTDPTTHFIGTTDGAPIQFRISNENTGQINIQLNNTGFGRHTLDSTTINGTQNTAIGADALKNNVDGDGNAALGAAAGYQNTTGSGNTLIGYHADVISPGLLGATAIGYNAKVDKNFSLTLGAPGTLVGIATPRPISRLSNIDSNIIGSDGRGINTNSITWAAAQNGFIQGIYNYDTAKGANGITIKVANNNDSTIILDLTTGGSFSQVAQNVMVAKGNGNIGIGTKFPKQKLDVWGKAVIRDSIGIGVINPTAQLHFSNTTQSRKIVLYDFVANDHQFFGFGINPSTLRYQVSSVGNDHVFFAGTSASTSNELLRIKGSGKTGFAQSNPYSRLSNTDSNIVSSTGTGVDATAISWAINATGYAQGIFNRQTAANSNGLTIKIAGTTANNTILDLSTSAYSTGIGNPVMTVLGSGNTGFGINNPITRLCNTHFNIIGSDDNGINTGSITWANSQTGYVAALYNGQTTGQANGLAVKIAGTDIHQMLLDLSTGTVQNTIGTSVLSVRANGSVTIGTISPDEKLNINGAIKIADGGYTGLINGDTSPLPAGGAGTIAFSNGHFFGWDGSLWKQLDN